MAPALELLYVLVLKDLRVRYKGSVLGYFWALANPLAFTAVYYVAFKLIIPTTTDHFALYLVTGLFPWVWAANALIQSSAAYRSNLSLVRKVRLPRAIVPLSSIVQEMVHFLFAVPILAIGVALATGATHAAWIWIIPAMALVQLAMLYPLGLILAATNVLVRDVEHLVGVALQMLFFLTPIVYSAESIPGAYRPYFVLNPFVPMIGAWRTALYRGDLDVAAIGRCLLFAGAAGLAAFAIHRRVEPTIGERL
jgi:lipopolysaccharide transport system permease protein